MLFDEIHDPFEDVQEWYIEYKNNLMKFLENAYIDKIHCGSGYRIIIMNSDEEYEFELRSFVARFVPKNNDDSDDYRDYDKIANELIDIRQLLHDNNVNLNDIDSDSDILLDEELRQKNISE